MFPTYLQLGFEHITDLNGYDHMLFLLALCAGYVYTDWKRILILVTAFTVGHSLTLALAVLNIIPVNAAWIEFLIPVTIAATAAKNVLVKTSPDRSFSGGEWLTYLMALTFGLIHGMGFSNYLRSLLGERLLMPLLAFNLGIELGQLLVVVGIFLVQAVSMRIFGLAANKWNMLVSVATGAISLTLAVQRIPF